MKFVNKILPIAQEGWLKTVKTENVYNYVKISLNVVTLSLIIVELLQLIPSKNHASSSNVKIMHSVLSLIFANKDPVFVILLNNALPNMKKLIQILVLANVLILKQNSLALIPISNGMQNLASVPAIFPPIDGVFLNVHKVKFMMLKVVPVIYPLFQLLVINLYSFSLLVIMWVTMLSFS